MADPRIPLKNSLLAVFLGLVIPGGGHLYQGRSFKGVLYCVCIVGTFIYGMFLSDWTALYAGSPLSATGRRWGFLAQAPIGLPAVYAMVQQQRYDSPTNVIRSNLEEPLSAPFRGAVEFGNFGRERPPGDSISEAIKAAQDAYLKAVSEGDGEVPVELENDRDIVYYELVGHIELRPIQTYLGPAVEGRFTGNLMTWDPETRTYERSEEPIELKLSSVSGRFELDQKIYADPERWLQIDVVEETEPGEVQPVGLLRGTIPRPLVNRLAVPLEPEKLQRLHATLGKTFDLAMVYTWIAALLNVLVLWDAYEGPAYGYGDETPEGDGDSPPDGKKQKAAAPASSKAPASSSA